MHGEKSGPELNRRDADPHYDACFTAFFLKNHIDPFAYPTKVGTREQVEFMVYPEQGERYYPCSDKMFDAIMSRQYPDYLKKNYQQILERALGLVDRFIDDEYDRRFLTELIRIKYDDEIRTGLLLPSRLEKRLYNIFLTRTHIENPFSRQKRAANRKVRDILDTKGFYDALNSLEDKLENWQNRSLAGLREKIKEVEFKKLLSLTGEENLWKDPDAGRTDPKQFFSRKIKGKGLKPLIDIMKSKRKKILWLCSESGQIMLDLKVIKFLAELGHVIILAVKEAPFFEQVCLADVRTDPVLMKELENANFIHEKTISKNSLVDLFKQDTRINIVSDGTREDLNLLIVSTTFSRIFKEVDCVVSRGTVQKKILIHSHFKFTQNIININTEKGDLIIAYKPKHPDSLKFSHEQLEVKAGSIIEQMRKAKENGMTIMFYSGIIGSIPGKIDVAKKIMTVFIEYLTDQSADLFIINPSLYYEPGMDADDLMYMWEIVQRSGWIDIWRFQTTEDIAKSFELMDQKVPPEWIGKDSTYSTGCTKEMKIAREVLKENYEMQLIGPSVDRFMRRNEYGVGSMYDQRLAES